MLYEDDVTPRWEQDQEVKDGLRSKMYPLLYERPYRLGAKQGQEEQGPEGPEGGFREPPAGQRGSGTGELKPFIPVSSVSDLEKVLGIPLGDDEYDDEEE